MSNQFTNTPDAKSIAAYNNDKRAKDLSGILYAEMRSTHALSSQSL